MSLRVWILLFILSIGASVEALVWAASHGQFRDPDRGRWLPLRVARSPRPGPRRRQLSLLIGGLALMAVVWTWGMVVMLFEALHR